MHSVSDGILAYLMIALTVFHVTLYGSFVSIHAFLRLKEYAFPFPTLLSFLVLHIVQ